MVHRVAAIAVLAAFLVLHLANHLFAIWSIPAQHTAMLALRTWYRAVWMEPVILALFVIAALAGLLRLGRLTRSQHDGFRVLQTASGCYLVFFLMSHVWATLGARYGGIDTDWAFASGGRSGLLASDVLAGVLFYYVGSLLAVTVHAGLGLRMVLLSRRVRAAAANRSARLVFAFGSTLSVLIVAALLGVRLGG
jgi:succinate dehydrogenase/fumarate reductase cytochrome b subunit